MKVKLFFVMLIVVLTGSSCTKDDAPVLPAVSVEVVGGGAPEVAQNDTLTLKVKMVSPTATAVTWSVDGQKMEGAETFRFIAAKLGKHTIKAEVANSDGVSATELTVEVVGRYREGVFILNEGNMTSENGFLSFISPNGVITDSIYYKVNKQPIGNVPQDMFIANGKVYIISQNGDRMGGNYLTVANSETMVKEAAYTSEFGNKLSWPTHVAVVGSDNVYIRDNKGVYLFNTTSKSLTFVEGSAGALKNRMAVCGSKVFVPAGRAIYVIRDGAIASTISLPGNVSGVVKSADGNLWVACTTTPAQILKISANDYRTIASNTLGDAKVGAGWGATPGISAKGDTIYFSNATTTIWRHIFGQNQTVKMVNVRDQIADAGIVYNNLGVDPKTGLVYFNTIKGYGADYLINDISVWSDTGTSLALKRTYKNHTHFPAGFFFTEKIK